ncbi:protein disks lost [Anopheles nili]|uniref:protein disks lost n=1 Tax=Anopheles nili TaxID=185578 RepID=UPI00237B2835|nr:protein disks lost [Anopheles nili]
MNEEVLKEMVEADIPPATDFLEWFLHYFKKLDNHQQRSLEAFAQYFIGFIRGQTELSLKHAPPRCDTPRKASTGSVYEPDPSVRQRKLSINDGSCYQTSGGVPCASTPTDEGRQPTNRASEPDTTGTPVHSIARRLCDNPGGPSDAILAGLDSKTLEHGIIDEKDGDFSTPKRQQKVSANGLVGSTPGSNPPEVAFSTPVRSGNATRSGSSSMLLSFTSTPIAGSGRGKSATPQGSMRNKSLGVSGLSPNVAGDGGNAVGRRNKTSSPALLTDTSAGTHPPKAHRNRRSPFAGNNSSGNSSSLFQDDDFPQLNDTLGSKDPPGDADGGKKRLSLTAKTVPLEPQQDATPDGGAGKKPQRRRIAPTTVSRFTSGRHDFSSSSIRSENNLMSAVSFEGGTSQDPRGMLRNLKDKIRNDFQAEQAHLPRSVVRAKQSLHASFSQLEEGKTASAPPENIVRDLVTSTEAGEVPGVTLILTIDFAKVTEKRTIDRLVAIYALLMDLNLVPNLLNELAYLINLVNTERNMPPHSQPTVEDLTSTSTDTEHLQNVLHSPHNCVYFAAEVLYRQRVLLALLDSTSLRVVVENEQLVAVHPVLIGFLRDMLVRKVKLEQQAANSTDLLANSSSITNVFYQQEDDTKDHFPSGKEFNAFNKQRDAFYVMLRTWEHDHLNPAWEFEAKLGPKVRAMLDISHHPINMAHLAKLFKSQLIISFNFDNSTSELQMALPNIDLTKLSKLRQRLVAPSVFSTQYLFPGSQMFFRDFILASENYPAFVEQLKAGLVHELLQMNGSSYELFNISESESKSRPEYVVRPETIATMRVLAKFLGFIIARPFQYEGCESTLVKNRQIELRNMLLPPFDVKPVLLSSVVERKLIITIPWLVQYLSMLDMVTLRLRYYEELFRMLHEIYKATAMCGATATNRDLFLIPTAKFIVRSSLDWLFDQSNVPEEYYNSSELTGGPASDSVSKLITTVATRSQHVDNDGNPIDKPIVFSALLENVLSAACPFLADFRVSVMPSRVEKTVSRTGRYRHITTRYSGLVSQQQASSTANETLAKIDTSVNVSSTSVGHDHSKVSPGNAQQRLVEAFLQSQSHSIRRTVELIIDRTTSAVIKDFQMLYLLPEKKAVHERVAGVCATTLQDTTRQIQSICDKALNYINNTWERHVPKMLNKRITESFDALLPAETIDTVRMVCKNITLEKCLQKSIEWRQSSISDTEVFCKNVPTEAQSLLNKSQQQQQQQLSFKALSTNGNQTELVISESCPIMPSTFYAKLQMLVHLAAASPERITRSELDEFLTLSLSFLDEPGLTTTPMMNRIMAFMLLQLFLLLIKSRCDLCIAELFERAVRIWKHPKLARFCLPPAPESDDNTSPSSPMQERSFVYPTQIEQYRRKRLQRDANYVFSHLISNRYIRMLEENTAPASNYEIYADFIITLLDAEIVTKDVLNEQFVAIFNDEWSKPTLDRVLVVINRVMQKSDQSTRPGHNIDDSHTEMFMAMLSDLARDITDL